MVSNLVTTSTSKSANNRFNLLLATTPEHSLAPAELLARHVRGVTLFSKDISIQHPMPHVIINIKKYLLSIPILLLLAACQENNDPLPSQKDYTYIFWTSIGDRAILRAILDPENDSILSIDTLFDDNDNLQSPAAVVADPTSASLYWTDYAAQQIVQGNWDGQGTPQVLYTIPDNFDGPVELSLDATARYLYWTHPYEDLILRANTSGIGPVDTLFNYVDGLNGPWGLSIQVHDSYLYWLEYQDTELHRASLKTGAESILYAGGSGFLRPYGLAVNNTDIFILDNTVPGAGVPDRILKGSTQGAPLITLYTTGVSNAYSIAVDNTHKTLYWLNQLESGGIWKGSADGTVEPRELIPNIHLGQGLTVITVKQPMQHI